MGFLGKLLVMLHSVLSLGMLTWAIGVYTQRINWKSPDQKDPGVFDRQKVKVDDLMIGMDRAYYRWTSSIQNVRAIEESQRYPRREFYVANLNLVLSGRATENPMDPLVASPVNTLAIDPRTGFLDVNPARPTPLKDPSGMGNLKSIAGYELDIAATFEEIRVSQIANKKALDDREVVNNEITGVTKPKLIKGLRQMINEQKEIEDEANLESTYVEGISTIRDAEFGLLKKRKDALVFRLDELKKYLDGKAKSGTGN